MKTVYIYALIDPDSCDARYVGLTRYPKKRLDNECRYAHNLHLRNWIAKLKQEGKKPGQLILETANEGNSCEAERRWIKHYRDRGSYLLNFTDGGEKGYKVSDETKEKLRELHKRRIYKPLTPEHRANIAAANKGKMYNPNAPAQLTACNISRIGVPLTEEHKRKVSEGVRKSITDESRAAMSERMKGRPSRPMTDEEKKKVSDGLKRWHAANKETFMETMSRRPMLPKDPATGRFLRTVSESG